ncbi:MAG: hypothetical protein ACFB4I_01140 [Cyanophyceae cyanobacterium]
MEAVAGTVEEHNQPPGRVVEDTDKSFWGQTKILRYEGNKVVVLFNEVGYKTLSVKLAVQRKLLKRLSDRTRQEKPIQA